jgi:hypothetical protein
MDVSKYSVCTVSSLGMKEGKISVVFFEEFGEAPHFE